MKIVVLLTTLLSILIPGYSFAAPTHDILIEWSYTIPSDGRDLAGYYLYKDGTKVCTGTNPTVKEMDCTIESEDGTYDFTLSSFFTDNTESNHSSPYPFTLSSTQTPSTSNYDLYVEWEYDSYNTSGNVVGGYNFYKSGVKICTSNDPNATSLDCNFDSLEGTFNFTLTAVYTDDTESQHSSPYSFTLSPTSEPALVAAVDTTPMSLSGDIPFNVSFDGADSTGNIASYSWNFGDNASATGQQVSHTYTTAGTFNAILTVTGTSGATSQKSVTVSTTTKPNANIFSSTLTGDAPLTVSFNAGGSTGDIASYSWNFGDNTSATGQQVSHTYTTAGTFNAILTVTGTSGATSQKSVTVSTTTPPNANISSSTLTGTAPLTVSFNASGSTGDIASYSWNFGDNTSATGKQVSHTYTTAGTYNATLTVTGTSGTTSQKTVTVATTTIPINANISSSTLTGDAPLAVSFNASGSTGDIASYSWNFGDNTSATGQQVSHTYTTAGTFNAILTVTGTSGATSQRSVTVSTAEPPEETELYDLYFEWTYENIPTDGVQLAGYNIYKNGSKVCSTNSPTSTYINCSFESEAGTFDFTITAFFTDNTESKHSEPFSYTLEPTTGEELIASIKATPQSLTGDAPFTVSFDGTSSANVTSYSWSFGDGNTSTVNKPTHTFSLPGSYSTKLTVKNSQGLSKQATVTVTVNEGTPSNTPPQAVIATSTAVGEAPFAVSFDGSGSSDQEGQITSYIWSFGDGTTASGATTTHTYSIPGTYSASLTVTDNQRSTDTVSTPIIITQPTVINNVPVAKISSSSKIGPIPLKISFSGSESTDPENGSLSYIWNFGDGSSAQGATFSHNFSTVGSYEVTLTVTDDGGASSSTTTTITAQDIIPTFHIELDDIEIDHNWARVDFAEPFVNPVVIAGPISNNGEDPSVIRLRNLSSTGFEIRVQEWNYLDGNHATLEKTSYLAMEKGTHTLENGTIIEAGIVSANGGQATSAQYSSTFATKPVVLTTLATFNDVDTATSRLTAISDSGFSVIIQNEEQASQKHEEEEIGYIAAEESQLTLGNMKVIIGKTSKSVKHKWYTLKYEEQLNEEPLFLGAISPQVGENTAALRYRNRTSSSVQIKVQEEQSKDSEIRHSRESVGYILFSTTTAAQ